jgi:hypothetical protein
MVLLPLPPCTEMPLLPPVIVPALMSVKALMTTPIP